MPLTLSELNRMNLVAFTQALGWVFEESPWVAKRAWVYRPFASLAALHDAMVRVVSDAPPADKLILIRAYPDLGTRVHHVSAASQSEHAGAGLDALTLAEFERFTALNRRYRQKFDFPFVMAVKGQTKQTVLAAAEERVQNDWEAERERALQEICQIAALRLQDAVTP